MTVPPPLPLPSIHKPDGSADFDLAIVGAGVAGLAAAAEARAAGWRCVVLEASARIGGRAWTDTPAHLAAPFEQGAIWLHSAERNPLVEIARRAGDTLTDADAVRRRRTFIDGRPATETERAAYARAWDEYEATAATMLAAGGDRTLDAVARARPDDPWAPTVENWEGPVIAAADADKLSLRDWHENLLDGGNMLVAGGLGAFVARRLGALAGPVVRACPVRAVRWDGPGVLLDTPLGTVRARGCIITVSTGVLAADGIRFTPALPPAWAEAIDALPMGLALKVALRAAGPDRLGLPDFCSLDRRLPPGAGPSMIFSAWPHGRDHVIGWVGGRVAWELTRAEDAAAEAHARDALVDMLGAEARGAFRPGAVVTRWGDDPRYLGAYAYARPGHVSARAALRAPIGGGRIRFAGEALDVTGLAGTVAGAWFSGRDATRDALGAAQAA
jgi:monoamine oxidase